MKNDTFNSRRFGTFAKKYFSDNREWFLAATFGFAILVVLVYVVGVATGMHISYLMLLLVVISTGWLVVIDIKAIGGYVGRKTGIMDTLFPASPLEKYLLAWSISFPLALGVLMLVILGINASMHYLTGYYISNGVFFRVADPSWKVVWKEIAPYFSTACIVNIVIMLGATTFSRGKISKQLVIGIAILAVAITLILGLPHWLGMPQSTSTGFPFFLEMEIIESTEGGATLWQKIAWVSEPLKHILANVVSASIPVVLWAAAYFKFKELEIR